MSNRRKSNVVSMLAILIILIFPAALLAAGESTMSADNIQYNIKTKLISAIGNVVITRAGAVITGDSGDGSTDSSEFTVKGNVTGVFPTERANLKANSIRWMSGAGKRSDGSVEATGKVRITRGAGERLNADYVKWEVGTKNYTARGSVDAVTVDHRLTAAEAGRSDEKFWSKNTKRYENLKQKIGLAAENIEGKIDIRSEELKEATATGDVVLDYIDKEGLKTVVKAPRAVYSRELRTVVMSGRAVAVRSDGKTVSADTLIVHEDTKNIEAKGNSKITFVINDNKDKNKPKGGE